MNRQGHRVDESVGLKGEFDLILVVFLILAELIVFVTYGRMFSIVYEDLWRAIDSAKQGDLTTLMSYLLYCVCVLLFLRFLFQTAHGLARRSKKAALKLCYACGAAIFLILGVAVWILIDDRSIGFGRIVITLLMLAPHVMAILVIRRRWNEFA